MEKWRAVKGFPWHSVSNEGRVRNDRTGKILQPLVIQNGSIVVHLNAYGTSYKVVGLIVADAFIPNPTNAKRVDYIDGDRSNCHVENLKWHVRAKKKRKGDR